MLYRITVFYNSGFNTVLTGVPEETAITFKKWFMGRFTSRTLDVNVAKTKAKVFSKDQIAFIEIVEDK